MKLPISLLVLAALSQALSVPVTKRSEVKSTVAKTTVAKTAEAKDSAAKSTGAKSSGAKQDGNNQTSKRELYEGNFGDRNKEFVSKYEVKGPPPKIVYAKELQEMIADQPPAHHMFGVRLPQIAKISDVLSGHGPSYEEAVARQLYSPVSVYQPIHSLATSFEVPTPTASQSGHSKLKAFQYAGQNKHNLQRLSSKSVKTSKAMELANPPPPLYTVNQAKLRFDSHPHPLNSGLARQHERLPEEVFHPQDVSRKHMPLLYPLYEQLGPFSYPGQAVPLQNSNRHGIFQIFPVAQDFGKSYKERNRDREYPSEENYEQLKDARPKFQIEIPVHKQGYHAHPNGAISFARFTHDLHGIPQHNTAPQPQSETFHQSQPAQYQSQSIPVQLPSQMQPEQLMLQSQEQKLTPGKQKLPFPPMLQGLIEDLEKYQPVYQQQPHYNPFSQQMQYPPRTLNALQQHLLLQEPQQSSNLQIIQLPHIPAFKPLPQSMLTPEPYFKKTGRSPIPSGQSPRPFSYNDQSENNDLSLGQASAQLSSLPPLKPNYSKYVKPLESNTTPIFLPTPLQTLSTSTDKLEPVSDQLISSTTKQPDVKSQENLTTQSIQEETDSQSTTPQPLKTEEFHQSQLTVQPTSVQSTTYLPFVTNEPQSIFFQYSTPQPTYQSTPRPTPQRHDVVIQRQEIQELFFEPQPSSTPRYRNQPALVFTPEPEVLQLRTHPHYQLFEQLLPYKQEYQDIHSPQQYIVEARESQQKPVSTQRGKPQQYLIQQHSAPLQQFQQQLLQGQQPGLEQSQQQQQVLNQPHQQQEPEQAHQQQVFVRAQQQSEQAQQQQKQEAEQAHQQQVFVRAQQQSEQAHQQQQHALEQAHQQIQESEQPLQQQYQQNSLESNNQIQMSTLTPPQETEKQTETVKIQQQKESRPELQQDSKLQSSIGKPDEQPEHLSEHTPNLEQPNLGPFLTPSVIPQLYSHQQLVAQPDRSPLLGVPSSDVQYFGQFAETIFGNH